MSGGGGMGWFSIVRLGLVQTALGAIVVLTTSTMNRVMVVELGLAAMVPGLLVSIHHAMQLLRPRLGYGSDVGGRRTPWILGGMVTLACGGTLAAVAIAWMSLDPTAGLMLAVFAFVLIGVGVGAAGTSLLVLLAKRVDESRRAPAATIVWVMMIFGFIITATLAGSALDPYTPMRLVAVTATVSVAAVLLTAVAVWGVEGRDHAMGVPALPAAPRTPFRVALAEVWSEHESRRFTVFVFISMLAYSAQDLILEPFAGSVFGFTPGESTKLAGVQHGGVLVGMVLVALLGGGKRAAKWGSLKAWSVGGCIASAFALAGLAVAGFVGPSWPLRTSVFILGVANGAFAVAAIGSMMKLAGSGHPSREGVRMGLWGAAQAIAFGIGGFAGTAASDITRYFVGSPLLAYSSVFAGEALLFLLSAGLALTVAAPRAEPRASQTFVAAPRDAFAGGLTPR